MGSTFVYPWDRSVWCFSLPDLSCPYMFFVWVSRLALYQISLLAFQELFERPVVIVSVCTPLEKVGIGSTEVTG
jgi:hypothetical protein